MALPGAYGGGGQPANQLQSSVVGSDPPTAGMDISTPGTTEQDIAGFSVAGGFLGTDGILEMDIFLTLTSVAGPPTATLRAYFGTDAVIIANALQIAANLTASVVRLRVRLQAKGASAQFIVGEMIGHVATAITVNPEDAKINWGNGTQDSTATKVLKCTLQFGSNVADTAFTFIGTQLVRLG